MPINFSIFQSFPKAVNRLSNCQEFVTKLPTSCQHQHQYHRQVFKASLRTDKDRQRLDSTETIDLQFSKTIVIHLKVLVGHSQSEAERILTMRTVDRVFVVIVLCPEKENPSLEYKSTCEQHSTFFYCCHSPK